MFWIRYIIYVFLYPQTFPKEELGKSGRLAPHMGKSGKRLTYITGAEQEMIDFLEKELGTSNFFDEVMERLSKEELLRILSSIQREYGFVIGGIKSV